METLDFLHTLCFSLTEQELLVLQGLKHVFIGVWKSKVKAAGELTGMAGKVDE